ncbi:MAG TPA: glutathione S-transferase family protein [Stellaceae bacterium]|nr:glutathione S-transferase family protein [Stellaceae bacterium]
MTETYRLHGRRGSGSIVVQILLEEIGLPYEFVEAEDTPEYRRLCPTGKVPALTLPHGDTIFESGAICIHLTDKHQACPLAPPAGSPAHGRYLQWMLFFATGLYDAALRYYYAERYTAEGEALVETVQRQALADFERDIGIAEAALSPFLLGEHPSAADIYLFMLAGWYPPDPAPLYTKFPKLGALNTAIAARPAVAKVMALQG